jgi:hypothetical protein
MKAEQLAVVQGWHDTRVTLVRWRRAPLAVLAPWTLGSLAVTVALLTAIWAVAELSTPDPSGYVLPGLRRPAAFGDLAFLLYRNGLVLALHALACVAGFMARSSLPVVAEGYTGVWRRIHERAGTLAIGFVAAATVFSLCTQAYALGHAASDLALQLGLSPLVLLAGLLPHAVLELTALFLPLAAWTLAARREAWEELLAATFVTVALAVPMLVAAALIETYVTPELLAILSEA